MTELRVVGSAQDKVPVDREAWIEAGRALGAQHSEASWEFADWLAAGHDAFGAKAVREAVETVGASPGKIRNYLRVSSTWPVDRRRSSLGFSHHLEVAALPESEAEALLDQAEAGSWSHRELRTAAREASIEGKVRRQARELRELKRQLAAAKADAGDAVARTRERLAGSRRAVRDEVRRTVAVVEEIAGSGLLESLHGNARRALARTLRDHANGLAGEVDAIIDRYAAAADRIEAAS